MEKFGIMKMFFLIFFILISIIYSQIDIIDPNVILIEQPKEEIIVKEQCNIPYYSIIDKYCRKYSLTIDLVISIVKVESNYNYKARSKKNAIGLMQIVPKDAGKEVYELIHGYSDIPSDSIIYIPEKNINYGCAYLYILENYYFSKVQDSISRMYCMITAYNTGPSNLIKAFIDNKDIEREIGYNKYNNLNKNEKFKVRLDIAINRINNLSSYKVRNIMNNKLPYYETVLYLGKVLNNMNNL